ncbi:peptidoglycan-binding protein [bacterium]|nr:MAG: peptidoglycan-binding protein [bacterium]
MPAPAATNAAAPPAPKQPEATKVWPSFSSPRPVAERPFRANVAAVQYLLRGHGHFGTEINGVYGPRTTAAVKAFQTANKLPVDGVAGPKTLALLATPVKPGDTGDKVRAVQILARGAIGHNGETPNLGLEVDGVYGESTVKAVRTAQAYENDFGSQIEENGEMSAESWCILLGGRTNTSQL